MAGCVAFVERHWTTEDLPRDVYETTTLEASVGMMSKTTDRYYSQNAPYGSRKEYVSVQDIIITEQAVPRLTPSDGRHSEHDVSLHSH